MITLPQLSGVRENTLRYLGELGRQVLDLREATRALKRSKARFASHTQLDDLWCVGYGATLRWNTRDPIARAFDDYANGLYEAYMVENAWCWSIVGAPEDLAPFLAELERRFALARLIEKVINSIAIRSRE